MSRTVSVTLDANVSPFLAGVQRASAAVASFDAQTRAGAKGLLENRSGELNTLANGLLKVGAVGVGVFAGAAKAAIDWESAFAGVKKTVDATPEGFKILEGQLRGLATSLPASHAEIAAVAEAAGQLGVKSPDIAKFTKTMIDLGETTNLSATDAATGLARFSNIMGTPLSQVDRLGSSLVGLGNNFATTEREIMDMSMRLAGVGNQIGMTEGDVMGMATAMSSVGIEAEAGGTAMSMSMKRIHSAVLSGSPAVEKFAKVAGMSADEFTQAWRTSPAQAMAAFVQGLGRVSAAGGDVNATLAELGIRGIRETDTLNRLAGAGSLLSDALAQGNDEFEKNTALTKEAEERYKTAAAQIQVAWNTIKDAAITAGAGIAPAIADAAKALASFMKAVGSLPPGVLEFGVKLAGIGGAIALLGGGAIKAAIQLHEFRTAIAGLSAASPTAAVGITKLGGALRTLGGVAAGVTAFGLAVGAAQKKLSEFEADVFNRNVHTISASIKELAAGKKDLDAFFGPRVTDAWTATVKQFVGFGATLDTATDLQGHMNRLYNPSLWARLDTATWGTFDKIFGTQLSGVSQSKQQIAEFDDALANLVKTGDRAAASEGFTKLANAMRESGADSEQVTQAFQAYRSELEATLGAMSVGVTPAREMMDVMTELARIDGKTGPATLWGVGNWATVSATINSAYDGIAAGVDAAAGMYGDAATAAQEAAEANEELAESLFGVSNAFLQLSGGAIGYEAALDNAAEAARKNGKNLDITTEAGRANLTALNQLVQANESWVQSMIEQGYSQEEIAAQQVRAREEWIRTAESMGMTDEQAQALAKSMGVTAGTVEELADELYGMPDGVVVDFREAGARGVKAAAESVEAAVKAVPERRRVTFAQARANSVAASANGVRAAIMAIPTSRRTTFAAVNANAAAALANGVRAAVAGVPNAKTTTFNAVTASAKSAVDSLRASVNAIKTSIVISVAASGVDAAVSALNSIQRHADGGPIGGYSPHPRADNILIRATAGEFMQPVAAVDYYGEHIMEALRTRRIPRSLFTAAGYADGGTITATKGQRAIPASTWSTPSITVTAPSPTPTVIDGATLYLDAAALVRALDKRDRQAVVTARLATKGR